MGFNGAMRKFQKQQIKDILKELHTVHLQSRNKLSEKEYVTVRNLFADCQEMVMQIGSFIESVEGTGTEAVGGLVQYCEKMYHLSTQLEEISEQKVYETLEEKLQIAEKAVDHLTVRKEVVFMPYKASMWDSLESVYLAAKEDANCDAYVVPIPYYDRNEDDSLGKMHYEGGDYPKNIEITYYEEYDLQQRHPDAIYIHNPYDEYNMVTSVPEQYFCRNLKKYTDCLVYIPYFILDEIELDDQKAIDSIKHFCFLPGIIWADKVIVQSEKMRQIYINEFIKEAESRGLRGQLTERKNLEDKILGLGSPKFDKVHNTTREDLEVPDEWLRIIMKSDGTWKKIILYNTSVGAFLDNDEKMLRKMKSVFKMFKEQREKVALMWRPHPLMSSTIQTMRPHLWAEYERLVQTYQEEGWGIYDDSADLNRAVVLSDAYYGDRSSVVYIYQETGKPLMIQDVEVS